MLVAEAAPELVAVEGVGTDTAASLLIAAGDNPERLKNEAAFAHLCGAAPIPASSGKSVRHRLNRHGNRDANRALYVIAVCRMSRDERTRSLRAKRTTEGKTKKEIIRCLKRYIAREVYRILASVSLKQAPDFGALTNIEASPGCYLPRTPVNKPSSVPRALARGIILDGGVAKRARSENASGAERGWCS